jgi:uncharacterized membrane protein
MSVADQLATEMRPSRPDPIEIASDAPWRWLSSAAAIYRANWLLCTGYGLLFVVFGYILLLAMRSLHLAAAFPVAVGGFALVGPLMACGLYAVARASSEGRKASAGEILRPAAASPVQLAYLAVGLLVALFIWIIAALAIYVAVLGDKSLSASAFLSYVLSTPTGLSMLAVGTLVGGVIATAIFCVSVFSFPMLMDQDTDFATAVGRSVTAVMANPKPMILWAWIIALCLVVGAATLLIGFVFLFPLLGLATWVGYRDTFRR